MKKKFSLILLALMMVLVLATFVACGEKGNSPADNGTYHVVTLNPQNGGEPITLSVLDGSTITFPSVTNGNQTLTGWYLDADCTQLWDNSTPVTNAVSLFAGWYLDPRPEGHWAVTLDLQNGSTPTVIYVADGSAITFPTVDNEEYRTFKGWYKDPEGNKLWTKSTKVTEDVTLYGCWANKTVSVTFDLNYAGAAKPTTEYRPMGQPIDLPSPERTYWVFAGWYLDAECTTKYDNSNLVEKTTLYAAWETAPDHTHSHEHTNVPVTCTTDGYDYYECICGHSYVENVVPATGHSLDFDEDDYMKMVICANEGCEYAERLESLRIYEDTFVYNFDDAKKAEIQENLDTIFAMLANADRYDAALHYYDKTSEFYAQNQAFEELFDAFYDDLMYLTEQYQYAYVFYCVKQSNASVDAFLAVSEYRTEKVSDFYAIYGLVYETAFREFFYDKVEGGWTDEEIEEALQMSDSYGDEEYAAIKTRLEEIEVESNDLNSSSDQIPVLYEEFVTLQNQLAVKLGYDNFMDYAYASSYGRDYTPEDAAVMRSYVKELLVPVWSDIRDKNNLYKNSVANGTPEATVYANLMQKSIFDSATASNIVRDYFKTMTTSAYAQDIDFFYHANELFKNGNYYTGKYQGAFMYWIPAQETSILYFGPNSYSSTFTFVHEFGHYYNGVYNGGASMPLDVDEMHSQGNEMMLLSYLEDVLPADMLRGMYAKLYYNQLSDMFNTIMLASAVDEFEYCVYTGTAPNGQPATYTKNDYDSLFTTICSMYGVNSTSYWRSVTIKSAGYYISYAMSALPCVELLAVAETEGFEAAQEKYFRFFTFTDDEANGYVDADGDMIVTLGFAEILEYIGLNSVFEEDLYLGLSEYFLGTTKDFSYPDAE